MARVQKSKSTPKRQLESVVQRKAIAEFEANGYYVIKIKLSNKNGIMDLIAIPKNSDVVFIEVKREGEERSPLQVYRAKELENHGIKVQTYRPKST
jgi:Holliday junction resolvase-like predicted endonuclease